MAPLSISTAADPWIGKLVQGHFRVLEKIGAGGMGIVYKADQVALGRPVALKMLSPNLVLDNEVVTRFRNEAQACSRLTHPNTITVHDFGQAQDGSLFIAMEFIPGRSLEALLKEVGALRWTRVVEIALQVCGSLTEAHGMGIIHRDLKPSNIMLVDRPGRQDHVKVLDFGIAKICATGTTPGDQRQALTRTGMVFGTPQYMCPEQIRGEKVEPRSDLYAIGVILYEMLTGDLPFSAETPMGLLTKHLLEAPRPIRDKMPHIELPSALEATVMKAMSKAPADRQVSMEELARELMAARELAEPIRSGAMLAASLAAAPASDGLVLSAPMVATRFATPVEAMSAVPTSSPGRRVPTALWLGLGVLGLAAAALAGYAAMADDSDDRARDASALVIADPGLPSTQAPGGTPRLAGPLTVAEPVVPVAAPTAPPVVCSMAAEGAARDAARAIEVGVPALRPCMPPEGLLQFRYDLGGAPARPTAVAVEGSGRAECVRSALESLTHPSLVGTVTVELRLTDGCELRARYLRPRVSTPRGRGKKDERMP